MKHETLLQTKRNDILRIAAQNGAYNVRVFGSVARGEARAESDIDFLVNLEENRIHATRAHSLKEPSMNK